MGLQHELLLIGVTEKHKARLKESEFYPNLWDYAANTVSAAPECPVLFHAVIHDDVINYFMDFLVLIPTKSYWSGLPTVFDPYGITVYGKESQKALSDFLLGVQQVFRNAPDEIYLSGDESFCGDGTTWRDRIILNKKDSLAKLTGLIAAAEKLSEPNHYLANLGI